MPKAKTFKLVLEASKPFKINIYINTNTGKYYTDLVTISELLDISHGTISSYFRALDSTDCCKYNSIHMVGNETFINLVVSAIQTSMNNPVLNQRAKRIYADMGYRFDWARNTLVDYLSDIAEA